MTFSYIMIFFFFFSVSAQILHLDVRKFHWFQENIHLERQSNLKTILGHFDTELLKDADTVVVSPGVPLENYGLSSLFQLVCMLHSDFQLSTWNTEFFF